MDDIIQVQIRHVKRQQVSEILYIAPLTTVGNMKRIICELFDDNPTYECQQLVYYGYACRNDDETIENIVQTQVKFVSFSEDFFLI